MDYDDKCAFCRIVHGLDPAQVVATDTDTIAFFPLKPATHGHTLVIPRSHIADVFELTEPIASAISRAVMAGARALRQALAPDGLNIINSTGEAASQTIFHLHVHLVPRWNDDHFGNIWPPSEPWNEAGKADVADAVREAWAGIAHLEP